MMKQFIAPPHPVALSALQGQGNRIWDFWTLRFETKASLKMSLGWGDIDGSVSPMLWRDGRPASGQLATRSAGNPVHRTAGQPVRRPGLLGYGRIRARQGAGAALVVELGTWHSEPRYVLAGLPPARPQSLRGSVPQLHGGLAAG